MRVFIGDEMITHGHALFENGQVRDGYILHLDQHLTRLFNGIQSIKLKDLPFTRDDLKDIITKAVALSGSRDCAFRYYLSGEGGRGRPEFYVIVEDGIPVKPVDGCKEL